ncbi:hypothetical protein K3G63_10395 [Hymenobacter sp. HSC-4F20]|uniref:hypothetical protein n=1 Tax=Hymenobacter sp. HSC-4F20 TaxID=2864135 RepID=UPI001C7337CA|nr:hypothetical protein [Hymenobacter sp. HSC-4F20]MBX0290850.1 hypothetical protein [Hymenobacter sp. HSC-4F20]
MAHHERVITLCYRKIITSSSARPWEKLVFEDTYAEFRLQAQFYNPERRHRTFGELLHHAPGAEQLHFLVSAAARGYVQQLQGLVPDVVNNLGKHFLKFSQFQFEIINSDLQDPARHQVAISFYAEPLTWLDTIGSYLLVADQAAPAGGEVLTHLFQIQPYLSIHALHPPR